MEKQNGAALYRSPETFGDSVVELTGWVRSIRSGKAVGFLDLNDGSCQKNVQIVLEKASLPNFEEIVACLVGTAFRVRGTLVLTPTAKQPFEVNAKEVEILGSCGAEYPLQKKRHSLEYLRSIAHLRPRTATMQAVFRVRSAAAFAIHRFFMERGFVYVHTPIITASDGEGAGELFRVTTLPAENPPLTPEGTADFAKDFFRQWTGLTVTGQLEGEAMALALGNIYTFGPTFRAEHSNTPRHAAEFWMVEPEMAFADLLSAMDLAEELLCFVVKEVLSLSSDEIHFLDQNGSPGLLAALENLPLKSFDRITYTEAVERLLPHQNRFVYPVEWGADLQSEHERFLTEEIFGAPLFVTDYPKEIKAFYMRKNEDGKTVAAMDLLVPGIGELIGGSQREERLTVLEEVVKERGMSLSQYEWYLDLRRYGSVIHSGFGMGFERLMMLLTGMENIRDVLPFPRVLGSAAF